MAEARYSSSGIPIKAVYTPADLADIGWSYERELGRPGEPPYTRGFTPLGYREQLWKMEMYAGFGSAEDANTRYRYLIEQGSTGGVSMALDLPTSKYPMLRYFIGRAFDRRWAHPRLIVCAPSGVTEVEKRAVEEAALGAGARRVQLIEEPIAAAIGAGLAIEEPVGRITYDKAGRTSAQLMRPCRRSG